MSRGRTALASVGVILMAFGGWLVIRDSDPLQLAPWILGPVFVHDAIIAPLLLGLVWLGHRVLPRYAQAPALVALIVCVALTAVAGSVLTRAGARPDNASLLDRNYVVGWMLAISLTVIAAVVATAINRRRSLRPGRTT